MKIILSVLLIVLSSFGLLSQQKHIEQSTPFENVLLSLKTDSASLFMNSFSKEIRKGETDLKIWLSRLNEGKEKFKKRMGDYIISEFSYKYEEEESVLVVFYKNEELLEMAVIYEDGWKLNSK